MRDPVIDQKNINQVFVEVNRLYMEAYGIYNLIFVKAGIAREHVQI